MTHHRAVVAQLREPMRKIAVLLVVFLLVAAGFSAQTGVASEPQQAKAKAKSGAQPDRIDGTIVRFDKNNSTMEVRLRRTNAMRNVLWSSETKWTERNKPADISLLKDGARVICLGKFDQKGRLLAARIDFR